ncbi:hypothetical protein [Streptomyces sp. NRRL S-1022]|uniref:hypothetical protein n=1 Tax=Streptomyces sp. NRRL S-1022 TaxID=1463880 RepID=UPI0004C26194|nr:hypothetical protein [Streptomyces sp. NRRL S-1022]
MATVATTTVPPFTPLPGGFITAQTLPDGRITVESWWLNTDPDDSETPYSQPVCCWTADDPDGALALIAEFTESFARLTRA